MTDYPLYFMAEIYLYFILFEVLHLCDNHNQLWIDTSVNIASPMASFPKEALGINGVLLSS